MTESRRVGVICGAGALPREVVNGLLQSEQDTLGVLIALQGSAGAWVKALPHIWVSLGQVGRIFHALEQAGCTDVIFAGAVNRPNLRSLRLDWGAVKLMPKAMQLFRQGDDGVLRGLAEIFEARGIQVIGAQEYASDSLASLGAMSARQPNLQDRLDLKTGFAMLQTLSPYDIGQAVILANGVCLGIEAVEGTAKLLERVTSFPNGKRGGAPRPSGVLIKSPKIGQDLRLDLPAIGPDTITQIAQAGLNGVAIAANQVFVLERAETMRRADALGVFIWGEPAGAV